jgi:hypothetical protein
MNRTAVGLTRPSTSFCPRSQGREFCELQVVDGRVKPGHDGGWGLWALESAR